MPDTASIQKTLRFAAKQAVKRIYAWAPSTWRYGSTFFSKCREAEAREHWTAEQFTAWQEEHLQRLVHHAYAHVPYYHMLFDRIGLLPEEIRHPADLARIPPLSKDDLRTHFAELTATNLPKKEMTLHSTSGTSGRPLRFYSERRHETYLDGDAYRWRHFRWGGCTPDDLRATLSARRLPARHNGQRRLTLYEPLFPLLVLSAYDLSHATIAHYARALERYRPPFLHGFPSALEALTRLLESEHIAPPAPVQAIFTQSEVLYPWQRERIGAYFGCKIFDWYGMEERVIAAAECEHHDGLHVFPDYCIVEVVDANLQATSNTGEILSTRLDNLAMPLLRYRTGDVGQLITAPCGCGRSMSRLKLGGGRDRNFLVTRDGGLISVTIVDIPHATEHIEQFQFVQQVPGAVTLKIIKTSQFGDKDLAQVHQDLEEKFGRAVDVTLEFTDHIERTARGKLPLLVQKLNLDPAAPAH